MGGGGDSEVVEGGGGVFDVSSDWRSEVGAGAEDAAMVLDGATELVVAAELVSAESVAEGSVPKCSPSGTGMGKSLGSQPGTSQSSSSSSSSSSSPSSSFKQYRSYSFSHNLTQHKTTSEQSLYFLQSINMSGTYKPTGMRFLLRLHFMDHSADSECRARRSQGGRYP